MAIFTAIILKSQTPSVSADLEAIFMPLLMLGLFIWGAFIALTFIRNVRSF
jgi:hypothetical protein